MDKTILIAEDEAPIAKLVQFKLEKKGYKIIHKNTQKRYRHQSIDLLTKTMIQ